MWLSVTCRPASTSIVGSGSSCPAARTTAGAHVQLRMPGGLSLELDTAESVRLWHAAWRADPANVSVVIGFSLPRAMYRGYWTGGSEGPNPARLHVIRESGPCGWKDWKRTLCGQAGWGCQNSDPVVIEPLTDRPPEGLSWCSECIGHLAEVLGLLDEIAASLAAYDPSLTARATR